MLAFEGMASALSCLERADKVLASSGQALKKADRALLEIERLDNEVASIASTLLCRIVKTFATAKPIVITQTSNFDKLANEIIIEIFRLLPNENIRSLGRVCKRWYCLNHDPLFYIARNFPTVDARKYSDELLRLTNRQVMPLNERIKRTKQEVDNLNGTAKTLFIINGVTIAVNVALLTPYICKGLAAFGQHLLEVHRQQIAQIMADNPGITQEQAVEIWNQLNLIDVY